MKHARYARISALVLIALLLCPVLAACTPNGAPKGMQDATCPGQDFILYVPMQWTVNSRSGISGAFFTTADHSDQAQGFAQHSNFWTISAHKVTSDAEDFDAYWSQLTAYYDEHYKKFNVVNYEEATEQKPAKVYRETSLDIFGDDAGMYPARVYEFTAEVKEFAPVEDLSAQEQMIFTRKYCQVICHAKDRGCFYVLTYSAREEDYDRFLNVFIGEFEEETVVGEFVILGESEQTKEPKLFKDPDTTDQMKPASTDEMPYRFYVPDAWYIDVNTDYPSAHAPTGSANATVMIYVPSDEQISVDTYWEGYCLPEYEAVFDSMTTPEQVFEGTIGTDKDAKNAKTYRFGASIGGSDYLYEQTVIVHSSLIYVVTYTALASDGSFEQHLDDYRAMLDSFTFR